MRRILLLFSTCLLIALSGLAAPVSPDEALGRIADAKALPGGARRLAPASAQMDCRTFTDTDREAALYLFTDSAGSFILAPADDMLPAVLAYGDKATAGSAATLPPAFVGLMEEYAAEISHIRKVRKASNSASNVALGRRSISPLLKSKWNQGEPFNNACPVLDGERTVTGCTATALAQVLYYHKAPISYSGRISNVWHNQNLYIDFSTDKPDYSLMKDDYNGAFGVNFNQQNADNVALLMVACGLALKTDYNVESAGGSSAYSYNIASALYNYFGIDKSAERIQRDYFDASGWDDAIYSELAAGRPVIYTGQSNSGGHAFVVDGYSEDRYFHVNWGWGGYQDGYFLLSLLDPADVGIGATQNSGFRSSQCAIINIKPDEGGSLPEGDLFINGNLTGYLSGSNACFTTDDDSDPGFWNFSDYSVNRILGIAFQNASTGGISTYECTDMTVMDSFQGFQKLSVPRSIGLINGTYYAYPYFETPSGELNTLLTKAGCGEMVIVTVSNRYISGISTLAKDTPVMKVFTYSNEPVYRNTPAIFQVVFENQFNNSTYSGIIYMDVYDASGKLVATRNLYASGIKGSYTEVISGSFSFDLPAGEYYARFRDKNDNYVGRTEYDEQQGDFVIYPDSEPFTIHEGSRPSDYSRIRVDNVTPAAVNPNQTYRLYFGFVNSAVTSVTGYLRWDVYDSKGNRIPECCYSLQSETFAGNLNKNYYVDGISAPGKAGKYYYRFYFGNQVVSDDIPFVVIPGNITLHWYDEEGNEVTGEYVTEFNPAHSDNLWLSTGDAGLDEILHDNFLIGETAHLIEGDLYENGRFNLLNHRTTGESTLYASMPDNQTYTAETIDLKVVINPRTTGLSSPGENMRLEWVERHEADIFYFHPDKGLSAEDFEIVSVEPLFTPVEIPEGESRIEGKDHYYRDILKDEMTFTPEALASIAFPCSGSYAVKIRYAGDTSKTIPAETVSKLDIYPSFRGLAFNWNPMDLENPVYTIGTDTDLAAEGAGIHVDVDCHFPELWYKVDAHNMKYSAPDDDVAAADPLEGYVRYSYPGLLDLSAIKLPAGEGNVTMKLRKNGVISDPLHITVRRDAETTGLDSVMTEDMEINVFDLQGRLLPAINDVASLKRLDPGIYVVVTADGRSLRYMAR